MVKYPRLEQIARSIPVRLYTVENATVRELYEYYKPELDMNKAFELLAEALNGTPNGGVIGWPEEIREALVEVFEDRFDAAWQK